MTSDESVPQAFGWHEGRYQDRCPPVLCCHCYCTAIITQLPLQKAAQLPLPLHSYHCHYPVVTTQMPLPLCIHPCCAVSCSVPRHCSPLIARCCFVSGGCGGCVLIAAVCTESPAARCTVSLQWVSIAGFAGKTSQHPPHRAFSATIMHLLHRVAVRHSKQCAVHQARQHNAA